jgi:hypothetical protein
MRIQLRSGREDPGVIAFLIPSEDNYEEGDSPDRDTCRKAGAASTMSVL